LPRRFAIAAKFSRNRRFRRRKHSTWRNAFLRRYLTPAFKYPLPRRPGSRDQRLRKVCNVETEQLLAAVEIGGQSKSNRFARRNARARSRSASATGTAISEASRQQLR
jgi:hypothetical protein